MPMLIGAHPGDPAKKSPMANADERFALISMVVTIASSAIRNPHNVTKRRSPCAKTSSSTLRA
jgi:hypothetical protein